MKPIHSIAVALQRLVRRLLAPRRKVWLEMHDGQLVVATAIRTEAGWAARWIGNRDQWSLLLKGGRVEGTAAIIRWMPHTGWDGADELVSPNAPSSATEGRP